MVQPWSRQRLLLLFGVFTRPVAFVLSGEMAFAYWMAHAPRNPFPVLNGGDAAICFKSGEYPIASGTFVVANKGHLKLTGVGPGTRLIAKSGEGVLRFENCTSVTVRDLHASATTSGTT